MRERAARRHVDADVPSVVRVERGAAERGGVVAPWCGRLRRARGARRRLPARARVVHVEDRTAADELVRRADVVARAARVHHHRVGRVRLTRRVERRPHRGVGAYGPVAERDDLREPDGAANHGQGARCARDSHPEGGTVGQRLRAQLQGEFFYVPLHFTRILLTI
jgi:hypothetical protein